MLFVKCASLGSRQIFGERERAIWMQDFMFSDICATLKDSRWIQRQGYYETIYLKLQTMQSYG